MHVLKTMADVINCVSICRSVDDTDVSVKRNFSWVKMENIAANAIPAKVKSYSLFSSDCVI